MKQVIDALNNSKLMVGMCILLSNLGGQYISLELSKRENKLLQDPMVRRLIVFTTAFMATRDIVASAIITLLFMLFVRRGHLFGGNPDTKEERS